MPKQKQKQKNKALSKKYVEVLEKFGLLPDFDFSDKEKKVVKALASGGDMDLLSLGDACEFKPEKIRKVCSKLLKKGAIVEKIAEDKLKDYVADNSIENGIAQEL